MSAPDDALPFQEQIQSFQKKLKLDEETFRRLGDEAHAYAFMVSGVQKQQVLEELFQGMHTAISEGQTFTQFKKSVLPKIEKDWNPKIGKARHLRLIYDTNLRQSYNQGRWAQIEEVKEDRPYLRYEHSGSAHPRPEHLSWDGIVLPVVDSFWDTHYPQNGFRCKRRVFSEDEGGLKRRGLKVLDKAPPLDLIEKVNKKTGELVKIPRGIDPGFQFNVGKRSPLAIQAERVRSSLKAEGSKGWRPLLQSSAKTLGTEELPIHKTTLMQDVKSKTELAKRIRSVLGPDRVHTIEPIQFPLNMNADDLAGHLGDLSRSKFVGEFKPLIEVPDEIWLSPEVSVKTGQVRLMTRLLRKVGYEEEGKTKTLMMSLKYHEGQWVSWTFIPSDRPNSIAGERVGRLLHKR